MDLFSVIAELATRHPNLTPETNDAQRIRDSLSYFSDLHAKTTKILVMILKKLGTTKSKHLIEQENLKTKEALEWTEGSDILKASNRDERLAIVKRNTIKSRKIVAKLESKLEVLECLKQACYSALTTLKLKQETMSRQLTLMELEERLES